MELFRELLLLWGISTADLPISSSTKEDDGNEKMSRLQVIEYLGISPRTYIRKVKDGTLKPIDLPGGHFYFKRDLLAAYNESKRRGRI